MDEVARPFQDVADSRFAEHADERRAGGQLSDEFERGRDLVDRQGGQLVIVEDHEVVPGLSRSPDGPHGIDFVEIELRATGGDGLCVDDDGAVDVRGPEVPGEVQRDGQVIGFVRGKGPPGGPEAFSIVEDVVDLLGVVVEVDGEEAFLSGVVRTPAEVVEEGGAGGGVEDLQTHLERDQRQVVSDGDEGHRQEKVQQVIGALGTKR